MLLVILLYWVCRDRRNWNCHHDLSLSWIEGATSFCRLLGSFSAMFDFAKLNEKYHHVLVSSTDGMGTKLLIAQEVSKNDSSFLPFNDSFKEVLYLFFNRYGRIEKGIFNKNPAKVFVLIIKEYIKIFMMTNLSVHVIRFEFHLPISVSFILSKFTD